MAAGVKVLGNFAFITAVIDDSLTVVDISNPLAPTFAGHVSGAGTPNFMGGARHLHLSLGRAYVVSANDAALTVVDISDPVTPSVVAVQGAGAPNFLEIPLDVFISGNHAYVASFGDSSVPRGDNSLSIFDVGVATLADLVAAVETLVAAGLLNKGQGTALIKKLERGLVRPFVNQVTDLVATGVLPPAEGQALIDAANSIIA